MRQNLLLALLCFGSSLLGSAVTIGFFLGGEDEELGAVKVLRAGRLVLVDSEGRARLVLAANSADSDEVLEMISLFDVNGVRKLAAGIQGGRHPFLVLENSEVPNPEHKRITLSVKETTATLSLGHRDIREIEIQSASPSDSVASRIELRARNSSSTAFYVDEFGHATFEVNDNGTGSIVRIPVQGELVPDE